MTAEASRSADRSGYTCHPSFKHHGRDGGPRRLPVWHGIGNSGRRFWIRSDNARQEAAMPRGWSNKDERLYEHVKESELDRGMDPARATEIAARTVNKQRREEGRSANKRTQGTGNPTIGYED